MKTCTKCLVTKEDSDFQIRSVGPRGTHLKSWCRQCESAARASHREANPERYSCKTNPKLKARTDEYRRTHTEQYNAWKLARKAELYAKMNVLKSAPCADCHQMFPPVAMDWDHLDGARKEDCIGQMVDHCVRWEKILVEVAKCDLVCSNCHRVRTFRRRQEATSQQPIQPTSMESKPVEGRPLGPVGMSGPAALALPSPTPVVL